MMDWDKLYNEYLIRFKKNRSADRLIKESPLSFQKFVKIQTILMNSKKNKDLKDKWFNYE